VDAIFKLLREVTLTQRLDRDSQQDDPPDRDAHLAAGDRVIAAVLQPEVDDQQGESSQVAIALQSSAARLRARRGLVAWG
jgi:hypothetical protein